MTTEQAMIPDLATPEPIRPTTSTSHLTDRLAGTSRRGVSAGKCHTCKTLILTGLDEDLCASDVKVDPTPLSRLGEALALLGGRPTYELRRHGLTALALWRRDRWQISGRTPGITFDVVAAHSCYSDALPTIPSVYIPTRKVEYDECPF